MQTATEDLLLGYCPPDAVALPRLEGRVGQAIQNAHELALRSVPYRRVGRFGRTDLAGPPAALSCSELVYYAYAKAGVDLGAIHRRTRMLAFEEPAPYAEAMVKVTGRGLLPGDLLVYHREREVVAAEVARRGSARPGHVVILVCPHERVVIGSHGKKSTPAGAPTGVGYRTTEGLERWTAGRTLQAVYRLR